MEYIVSSKNKFIRMFTLPESGCFGRLFIQYGILQHCKEKKQEREGSRSSHQWLRSRVSIITPQ